MGRRQQCRNGHVRTAHNTHVSAGRVRCKDCPSWSRPRQERQGPGAEHYHRVLSEAELARLRSLIPCLGCGAVPDREGETFHQAGCRVAHVRESDDGPPVQTMRAA